MDAPVDPTPALPLEIVRQIANLLANSDGRKHTISLDMQNCSLVNLTFASAFQPHLFHRTYLSGTSNARVQKRLDILLSSPHLATYVKHLTLTLSDEFIQSTSALPALLDRFTSLKSLTLAFFSCRIPWESFCPSFRASVKRLCDLQTLETLNLNQVEGVPASLFMANRTLTSVSISGSSPVFDFVPAEEHHAIQYPSLPVSFNAMNVDLTKYDLNDMVDRARAFFSRIRSFSGTVSWMPEKNLSFNAFVSLLAATSRGLEHLEVTTDSEYVNDGGVVHRNLLRSFNGLKGLKTLSLSTRQPPAGYLHGFIAALSHAICSLDTASLQHLSISILALNYERLPYLCGSQGLASIAPRSLDGTLAAKGREGKLRKLEEVVITIQIDRSELNQPLEELRRLVRKATFLPSLPVEKVRVVLKSKVGAVMYDGRLSVQAYRVLKI